MKKTRERKEKIKVNGKIPLDKSGEWKNPARSKTPREFSNV